MNQGQPQQQINIGPEDTTGIKCLQCKGIYFIPVYMLRKVSALISPTGQEEVIQVPVMSCAGCGKPYMGDEELEGDGSNIIV